MIFNRDDPNTWPVFRPLIIAHDVGRSRDRSTAVVGGLSPFEPRLTGIKEAEELAQGLYGTARASALAAIIAATILMLSLLLISATTRPTPRCCLTHSAPLA
jgi:hypothetical protein